MNLVLCLFEKLLFKAFLGYKTTITNNFYKIIFYLLAHQELTRKVTGKNRQKLQIALKRHRVVGQG